jgi:hypothetical protein
MSKLDPEVRTFLEGLTQAYQHALLHSTETAERLTNGIMNHVLEVATRAFPAAPGNYIVLDYGATIGAIEIYNHGATYITVASGGGSGILPQGGTGVSRIDPGKSRTINVNSRSAVIYGAAGEFVGYQAFTKGKIS